MLRFDPFKAADKIPVKALRLRALDRAFELGIPFNAGLGLRIKKLTSREVIAVSDERRKRRNHVGSAHACFLALLSEYPAGLLLAQNYSFENYRLILGGLNMEYHKQGRGRLTARALWPESPIEFESGEAWVEMVTLVTDAQNEQVSTCKTRWQLKQWSKVRKKGE